MADGRHRPSAEGPRTAFTERMMEVLRKSPVLRLGQNKTVTSRTSGRPPRRSRSRPRRWWRRRRPRRPRLSDWSKRPWRRTRTCLPLSQNGRGAGLWAGERRGQSEAGVRGGQGGLRQELRPPVRDRLRHPAHRPRTDREMRRGGGRAGDLRAGHARPVDGRSVEEHALQPDIQRMRAAGGRGHAARTTASTRSSCWGWTFSTR